MKLKSFFPILNSYLYVTWFAMMTVAIVYFHQGIFAQEVGDIENESDLLFFEQVATLSEKTKQETVRKLTKFPKHQIQGQLLTEISAFRTYCSGRMPRQQVQGWNEELKLNELEQSLRKGELPIERIEEILAIFRTDRQDFQRAGFVRLEKKLKQQLALMKQLRAKGNQKEIEFFFDSLPNLVKEYCQSPNEDKAKAVSESIIYLNESCDADELVTLLRERLAGPNLRVCVSSNVVAKLLRRKINEPVAVNENILGTYVRGSGDLIGTLNGVFVPREDAAVIRVTLNGELKTSTVGSNGPVRLHSDNTTTVETVKDIVLTPNGIATAPASTKAQQLSLVNHVNYLRNGPLVRRVAPNQIRQRKPASDAESERLTRAKLNSRVDKEIDGQVKRLNGLLKGSPDSDSDLQLTFEQLQTTAKELSLSAYVGTHSQLGSTTAAPTLGINRGIFVQCHESLLRNAGSSELSGKTLIEEQVIADLKERFPKIAESIAESGKADESPLTVTFAEMPIDVTFADNCIGATVEAVAIEREGNRYPGMSLEIRFCIESVDGGFQLVPIDSPEVLPTGFDKEKDLLSARETTIRAVIMKKLEKGFEKPITWNESVINGENGTLTLKPVHLSTSGGWLSLGLDVVDWKPNQGVTSEK